MKRTICLMLVMALAASMLTGCGRRRSEPESPAASASAGNFEPDNVPGYTIVNGGGSSQDDGLGDDQPTPEPIETLPPETIELEKRRGAGTSEDNDVPLDVPLEELPGGEIAEADDLDVSEEGEEDIVMGTYDEEAEDARHGEQTIIDPSSMQFSAVIDDNLDYTFYYPTDWINLPGIYTVCYKEPVEPGDFPSRIAITRKRLVHTPDDAALMKELVSYMRSISRQYQKSTFQVGVSNRNDTFMGKQAFSNTYLAYWGDIEVKGYVIGAAIDRTVYVLHFSASYSDFQAMQNVLKYIIQSAKPKVTDTKKK